MIAKLGYEILCYLMLRKLCKFRFIVAVKFALTMYYIEWYFLPNTFKPQFRFVKVTF